jgi:hypothetical protein
VSIVPGRLPANSMENNMTIRAKVRPSQVMLEIKEIGKFCFNC